ncbi:MAG TPA: DUF1015 domain-containing protein [Clostridia bacterium]|jgi:uncharacterized protein (DUF1015 family)|nr:DUF1015 domain-containing protein [Clostridia bacterium]
MAELVAFKGVRYNQDLVGDLRELTTPPYDVIGEAEQQMYYDRHPNNIIRLEFGKIYPTDTEDDNRYTRAADYLRQWLESGILKKEEKPAFYLYEQEFSLNGERLTRTGFICGVKLADYSERVVLPHEETLAKPKEDRLKLMKACLANFSSIFGLYRDEEQEIEGILRKAKDEAEKVEFTDDLGDVHRLWIIDREDVIKQVQTLMANRPIYIADGHHRYETALHFKREMEAEGKSGYDYVMMTLVNVYDSGLVVLPTHRLVKNVTNFSAEKLIAGLKEDFELELVNRVEINSDLKKAAEDFLKILAEKGEQGQAFGLCFQDGSLYLLINKEGKPASGTAAERLDVSVLQQKILEKHLSIGAGEREKETNLIYTRDEEFALRAVLEKQCQLCFFLNPTRVTEVTDVADENGKMPQKSTYFYPKLITGLVLNCF